MSKLGCLILSSFTVTSLCAQTFKSLASFDGTDGSITYYETLAQGTDGALHGTTERGGAGTACSYDCGTIFRMTPAGTLTSLFSFDSANGANPYSGLTLDTNGALYGTTCNGGTNKDGTVFRVVGSTVTTLHNFEGSDGACPYGALFLASSGELYGTTTLGGTFGASFGGYGTLFRISPGGTFASLYSFDLTDGAFPYGGLVQAASGLLYGTTRQGGSQGFGTVFSFTPAGVLTTIHDFNSTDGSAPQGTLVEASDGNLYGTTEAGGEHSESGTIFSVTTEGGFTSLYSFCAESGCADGGSPRSGLIQATDSNFYGTTSGGGSDGLGEVFRFDASSATLNVLHSFSGGDGATPEGGLLQATNGLLYGTTFQGGADGFGTVFSIALGLRPFVTPVPSAAAEQATVKILGYKLTGATAVSFNGESAVFTVNSTGTSITATVPSGATTGEIEVTTPSATLSSSVPFRVIP
jgi:uncharacterized repeat protein (TIGR03803 family)